MRAKRLRGLEVKSIFMSHTVHVACCDPFEYWPKMVRTYVRRVVSVFESSWILNVPSAAQRHLGTSHTCKTIFAPVLTQVTKSQLKAKS